MPRCEGVEGGVASKEVWGRDNVASTIKREGEGLLLLSGESGPVVEEGAEHGSCFTGGTWIALEKEGGGMIEGNNKVFQLCAVVFVEAHLVAKWFGYPRAERKDCPVEEGFEEAFRDMAGGSTRSLLGSAVDGVQA